MGSNKEKITETYISTTEDLNYQQLLSQCRKHTDEPVSVFTSRFLILAKQAYAGNRGSVEEKRVVGFYLCGLCYLGLQERQR